MALGGNRPAPRLAALAIVGAALACPAGSRVSLDEAEYLFETIQEVRDQIDVTRFRGARENLRGEPLEELIRLYHESLPPMLRHLESVSEVDLTPEQAEALHTLRRRADEFPVEEESAPAAAESDVCNFPAGFGDGLDQLLEQTYACFGEKAGTLELEAERLDRLTVLGRLAAEESPSRRRALFFALQPLWESMHGPFRRIVQLSAAAGTRPESAASLLGVRPEEVEPWLVSLLEAWSRRFGVRRIEPWDYWYEGGEAARALQERLPAGALRGLNDRFYSALGAEVRELGIHYDLEPRPGKDPVAFTTFGRRNRLRGGRWNIGEFWVFATYREGGLGNLAELLHETGHGVHLAAIRTRPAYQQWPDSIVFTEAVADLATWEAFEPEWQREFLGAAAPAEACLRARLSAVVLDAAWALLEIRLHRDPTAEPNQVWTEITSGYLGIEPHPELAWWALRGQLVSDPGYMLNYALGAVLVADLRREIARRLEGRPRGEWYPLVSEQLFRWGLEKPTVRVVEEFLGRPTNPEALVAELANP